MTSVTTEPNEVQKAAADASSVTLKCRSDIRYGLVETVTLQRAYGKKSSNGESVCNRYAKHGGSDVIDARDHLFYYCGAGIRYCRLATLAHGHSV